MAAFFFNMACMEKDRGNSWSAVLAILVINSCRSIGFMAVLQLLLVESFPTEVRGHGCGLTGIFAALNMFGAIKLYPWFLDILGLNGTFLMFAAVMLAEVRNNLNQHCN